jgi:hypothetical protein
MSTPSRWILAGRLAACALLWWGLSAPAQAARITLLGTTVDADGVKPSVGVRVTLWPQGFSTLSDRDGDFLIDWDGSRGWLTLVPPDSMLTGSRWCKRLALDPADDSASPTKDLGLIRVMGRARLVYQKHPTLPTGTGRPDSLNLPGPAPGDSDTCQVRLRFDADIWGHVTRIELLEGDARPPAVVEAILDWVRHVDWVVPAESTCDEEIPFASIEDIRYVWSGTTWRHFDPVEHRMEQTRRQREARRQAPETTPR